MTDYIQGLAQWMTVPKRRRRSLRRYAIPATLVHASPTALPLTRPQKRSLALHLAPPTTCEFVSSPFSTSFPSNSQYAHLSIYRNLLEMLERWHAMDVLGMYLAEIRKRDNEGQSSTSSRKANTSQRAYLEELLGRHFLRSGSEPPPPNARRLFCPLLRKTW